MPIDNYTIEYLWENKQISSRAYNVCKYNGMLTISDICEYYRNGGSFGKLRNCGDKTISELNGIASYYMQYSFADTESNAKEVSANENDIDIFDNLTEDQTTIAKYEYNRILLSLSVRAQNVLSAAKYNYRNIIDLIQSNKDLVLRKLQACGEKTYKELIVAFSSYIDFINQISNYNEDEIARFQIKINFSFLYENEITQVYTFSKQNGHYPMFYIAMKYFERTTNRNEKIFAAFNGIGIESNHNICLQYNLTFERTRQISKRTLIELRDQNIFSKGYWNYYNIYEQDYIITDLMLPVINNSEFTQSEHIDNKSLASIIEVLSDFYRKDYNDSIMLFSDRLSSAFNIKDALSDIIRTATSRCTQDTKIPLSAFIDNYLKEVGSFDINSITNCLKDFCQNIMNIEVDQQYNCIIQQNAIDAKIEAYNIIKEYGAPMYLDEIFQVFKEKFPNHKYTQPKEMRAQLILSKDIVALGRTSTYALAEWGLQTESIRNFAYNILNGNDHPMTLQEIVNIINSNHRKTSINSLNTIIGLDNTDQFVKFKGGYIGLNNKIYDKEYEINDTSRTRQPFEDRLSAFISFIDRYHYSPQSNGEAEEQTLYRWYNNVIAGRIENITEEQKARFRAEIEQRNQYIYTTMEYNFMKRCENYKLYINDYGNLPKYKDDQHLYSWFSKNYNQYLNYTDKRKHLFEDLLNYMADFGFFISPHSE